MGADLFRRHGASERGQALIAILLVAVILGVVAVLVIRHQTESSPAKTKLSVDASVVAACTADLAAIKSSLEAVLVHEGAYPTDLTDLVASSGKGGLLHELPNSAEYQFTYPGTGGPPHVDVAGRLLQSVTDSCVAS